MLKKLRWKFIASAMLSLLGVMFALLVAINFISTRYFESMLDSELDQLVHRIESDRPFGLNQTDKDNLQNKSDSSYADSNQKDINAVPPKQNTGDLFPYILPTLSGNLPSSYFYVHFLDDGTISDVNTDHIYDLEYEDAVTYAQTVLDSSTDTKQADDTHKNFSKGTYKNFRYQISRQGNAYTAYFLESGYISYSLRMFRAISFITAAVSCLLVFMLVVIFSGHAVRPFAENLEKQKRFITDAGHELKTPITIVSANNELLRMNNGSCEWNDGISDQTKRMSELVGRLIELSRLDEEKPPVTRADFQLSDAAADTASAFYSAAERAGKKLSLDISPDIIYRGDEGAIRELISILLDNAVKYCDEGGKITLKLTGGHRPTIAVSNSFKGVGKLELNKLFDRFYRADKARTGGSGYGLGLSIAKSIAAAHKAEIRAMNMGGDTICFEVKL
jgi:Signal transduction histidine kinase